MSEDGIGLSVGGGEFSKTFQLPLTRLHALRRRDTGNLEDPLPAIHPIVPEQRLDGVPAADFAEAIGIRAQR